MNEIKIYLNPSGNTAELYKDFNLYQESYRNAQITLYVPKSLLYENADGTYLNVVKTGAILTAPNGAKVTTKSFNAEFVKTVEVDGIKYALYTQLIPKEFVIYAGTQIIVCNVLSIDNTNAGAPQIISVTTSQVVPLTVLASAFLDNDEPLDPTEAKVIEGLINSLQKRLTDGDYATRALYAWRPDYTYSADEIVSYPQKGQYGTIIKSLVADNKQNPYVDGEINSKYWAEIVDYNVLNGLYGLRTEVENALAQSQANAAAANESAAEAANAMADAQSSAQSAQEVAESIKDSTDYLEGIQNGTLAVNKAEMDGEGNNIASQFSIVQADISGLREDISNEAHFRGMFESVEALRAAYPTATPNDYAYIVGGNIYIWQNNAWTNSGQPSPNTAVPASNATPLMNGVASAGTSSQYSRGDHRHPTDTSKVNKSGDTMTGPLTFHGEGEGIKYKSGNRDAYSLRFFQGTEQGYGDLVQLGDGGTTIVGAGESADTVRERLQTYDTETLYLAADDTIEIIAGADSYSYGNPTVLITPNGLYEKGSRVFSSNNKPAATDLLAAHPVGTIYISTNSTSPASLFGGTWAAVSNGYYLKAVTSGAGQYGSEGLPNIRGSYEGVRTGNGGQPNAEGALYMVADTVSTLTGGAGGENRKQTLGFDASRSNSIYGRSLNVTPLNYGVYMWRRTA